MSASLAVVAVAGLWRACARSDSLERRQIRWVLLGCSVALGRAVLATLASLVLPVASRASGRTQPPVYARRTPEETPLFAVVRGELETYLARACYAERVVPRFVERELRAYLECGLLCHGFVRVRCGDCGRDRLVAFSCKGRGFCPACVGRRTADTAAHLVDRVLPQAPVRTRSLR
jgi:hypothetical protein